jgi:predicted PurR-regulated permease PerM
MRMTTFEFFKRTIIVAIVVLVPLLIWLLFDVVLVLIGSILICVLLQLVSEPFTRWCRASAWLIRQLIEMLVIGIVSAFAVWQIGLQSPVALGVIAGMAEFIPYVGPIIASVPAVLVAATNGLDAVLWTVFAYLLIHQLEGEVLAPLIQRRMVYIPPAVMLLGIVTISSAFGVSAIIFAAPIVVILFVAINKLYLRETLGEPVSLPGEQSGL